MGVGSLFQAKESIMGKTAANRLATERAGLLHGLAAAFFEALEEAPSMKSRQKKSNLLRTPEEELAFIDGHDRNWIAKLIFAALAKEREMVMEEGRPVGK